MRVRELLTAVLVLVASTAYAQHDHTTRRQRASTIVNGADFFQLVPGKQWTLTNPADGEVLTITVEDDNGATRWRMVSTSHSNDRLLYLDNAGGYFFMGNANGSELVGDAFPDDIRLTAGARLWFTGHDGIACPMLPSGDFVVPSSHTAPHRYYVIPKDAKRGSWGPSGTWNVRWDLVDANTLRIRVDENFGPAYWHSDFILCKHCGLTEIRQWADAARTTLVKKLVGKCGGEKCACC